MIQKPPLMVADLLAALVAGQSAIIAALSHLEALPVEMREHLSKVSMKGRELAEMVSSYKGTLLL